VKGGSCRKEKASSTQAVAAARGGGGNVGQSDACVRGEKDCSHLLLSPKGERKGGLAEGNRRRNGSKDFASGGEEKGVPVGGKEKYRILKGGAL